MVAVLEHVRCKNGAAEPQNHCRYCETKDHGGHRVGRGGQEMEMMTLATSLTHDISTEVIKNMFQASQRLATTRRNSIQLANIFPFRLMDL